MTNEQWNTTLYKQMFTEQEQFRDWLLAQPPQEILNYAYEYVMREGHSAFAGVQRPDRCPGGGFALIVLTAGRCLCRI